MPVPSPFTSAIDASTRCCAVLGWPVRHSASPAMQNAGIAALNLNWRYLAFETPPDSLRAAIAGAMHLGFIGLNLTIPHKLAAVNIVEEIDEQAKVLGAINTIRFEACEAHDSPWLPIHNLRASCNPVRVRSKGFNTDADAIVRVIQNDLGLSVRGARIILLGAGGVARAAAIKLTREGAGNLYLVNRTESKARALADELSAAAGQTGTRVHVGYAGPGETVDLVINGTSLGMKPTDPLPFDPARLALSQVPAVFDMVYRRDPTPLLQQARVAGCKTTDGLGMLLYQGAAALELWSGMPAPVEAMRAALLAHVRGGS